MRIITNKMTAKVIGKKITKKQIKKWKKAGEDDLVRYLSKNISS